MKWQIIRKEKVVAQFASLIDAMRTAKLTYCVDEQHYDAETESYALYYTVEGSEEKVFAGKIEPIKN